nr:immunoglobulin light chain junction region [Macaca mulatta]MOW72058.1 immunoglobulin light chain junction region [Macaca mulatta]MOW72743.1 immunoglobulin light chain junction region [Macaca mulatta]
DYYCSSYAGSNTLLF